MPWFDDVIDAILTVAQKSNAALSPPSPGEGEPDGNMMLVTDENTKLELVRSSGVSIDSSRLGDYRFVVVDGSSRRLGTHGFRLFISGVAVYGLGNPLMTYPRSYIGEFIGELDWGFLAIKAPEHVLREIENNGELRIVRVKSLSNEYFTERFNDEAISDELRMGLETKVIEKISGELRNSGNHILIIDGPMYFAINTQRELSKIRISVINKLDLPTIGVVKRVDVSRKLCKDEFLEFLRDRGVNLDFDLKYCNDAAIMTRLGQLLGVDIGNVLIVGPFTLRNAGSGIERYFTDDRVFWYVYAGLGSGVFRLETLSSIYKKHGDLIGNELIKWLASGIDGSGIPYLIDVADYYAKALVNDLYLRAYWIARSRSVRLDYDTVREVESLMGGLYAAITQ